MIMLDNFVQHDLKKKIMKKILYALLLIVSSINCFAQKSCEILYEIEATANFFEKENPDMHGYDKKINEAINKHASDFSFLLKIKDNESYFASIKTMTSDNDGTSYKLASAMLQSNLKYYLNTTSKQKLTEIEAYGKKYILYDSINDWEISKDQKRIGEYTCYKATTKKTSLNSQGEFITEIVAWFTTELPYSFGPIGYGGLPGLILELQDGVIKYRVNNINHVNNIKISKPSKGEFVTDKELLEISQNATESRGF